MIAVSVSTRYALSLVNFNVRAGLMAQAFGIMAKKYEAITEKVISPTGRIVQSIRVAIIEMSCLGERQFDISGYPYDTPMQALADDWDAIGKDADLAARKVIEGQDENDVATKEIEQKPCAQ